LLYTVRTPTTYPSDAQLLPNGNILVAGFNTPGRVDELTPSGRIVWSYAPAAGSGALDRPSLAVRWPNGMIAVTDDWHHRVVVIDPQTKRIVWSYGHIDIPGRGPGYLDKPDGLDLLPAAAPSHARPRSTSRTPVAARARVERVGSLPAPLSKAAAIALPDGRLVILGGLVNGSSTTQILAGSADRPRVAGQLPVPTHDAAAALLGKRVLLFGGGQSASTNAVVAIDPSTGSATAVGKLDEPLSDLGAVTIGGKAYLVGGYTGTRFASAASATPATDARRRSLGCRSGRATRASRRSGTRSTSRGDLRRPARHPRFTLSTWIGTSCERLGGCRRPRIMLRSASCVELSISSGERASCESIRRPGVCPSSRSCRTRCRIRPSSQLADVSRSLAAALVLSTSSCVPSPRS
jgi:hypothetical protein